jgi:hypothetical protein
MSKSKPLIQLVFHNVLTYDGEVIEY